MTNEALSEMLKLSISALNDEVDVLIDAGDLIWMINEIQRLRSWKQEHAVRLIA